MWAGVWVMPASQLPSLRNASTASLLTAESPVGAGMISTENARVCDPTSPDVRSVRDNLSFAVRHCAEVIHNRGEGNASHFPHDPLDRVHVGVGLRECGEREVRTIRS